MAVVNKWANANQEAGRMDEAATMYGAKVHHLAGNFEVASGDDDGSVYKLGRLPANAVPIRCRIWNDTITSGSDYDLGLYKDGTDGPAGTAIVVDKEVFASTLDMSSGAALGSPKDGLKTGPSIDEIGDKVWELTGANVNTKEGGYILALTANTVGSAAGTIAYDFEYILN